MCVCVYAGKFPDAVKHYDEAIKRNPDDAKIYSNRAACYQKLLEFSLALKVSHIAPADHMCTVRLVCLETSSEHSRALHVYVCVRALLYPVTYATKY